MLAVCSLRVRLERKVHKLERHLNTDERRGVGGERTGHGGAEAGPEGGDTVLGDKLAGAVEEAAVRAVGRGLDAGLDGLGLASKVRRGEGEARSELSSLALSSVAGWHWGAPARAVWERRPTHVRGNGDRPHGNTGHTTGEHDGREGEGRSLLLAGGGVDNGLARERLLDDLVRGEVAGVSGVAGWEAGEPRGDTDPVVTRGK